MKTNSAAISLLFFSKTRRITFFKRFPTIFSALFLNHKKLINHCLAFLAIGAVFLGAIIAFLVQLAEYGW
ncbi:hypothetical protein [Desulfomarina sp.]